MLGGRFGCCSPLLPSLCWLDWGFVGWVWLSRRLHGPRTPIFRRIVGPSRSLPFPFEGHRHRQSPLRRPSTPPPHPSFPPHPTAHPYLHARQASPRPPPGRARSPRAPAVCVARGHTGAGAPRVEEACKALGCGRWSGQGRERGRGGGGWFGSGGGAVLGGVWLRRYPCGVTRAGDWAPCGWAGLPFDGLGSWGGAPRQGQLLFCVVQGQTPPPKQSG